MSRLPHRAAASAGGDEVLREKLRKSRESSSSLERSPRASGDWGTVDWALRGPDRVGERVPICAPWPDSTRSTAKQSAARVADLRALLRKLEEAQGEEDRTKIVSENAKELALLLPDAERLLAQVSATPHQPAPYRAMDSDITGFLIDLDGTIYKPDGLISGAKDFLGWLINTNKPFVLLSNTGAKGSVGVQQKLARLQATPRPIKLKHCFTAAEAQIEYIVDNVPPEAKIFVIAGGEEGFWLTSLRSKAPLLCDSWDIRTTLTEEEVKEWTVYSLGNSGSVFVVFFVDGEITQSLDPETGEIGYADWSYDVIKKATYLLAGGANFVYTADDAFNPSMDSRYPGVVFPMPGPGMFASMFRLASYPRGRQNLHCAGKGGDAGARYMMEHAVSMLQLQGHSGDVSKVMMIGDRFDTDIAGAASIGCKSCLVESGCHSMSMQSDYPEAKADYFAPSVAHLVPHDPDAPLPEKLAENHSASVRAQAADSGEDSGRPIPREASGCEMLASRSSLHPGYAP